MKRIDKIKYQRIIDKNTFFFKNDEFEEEYEGVIAEMKQLLLSLKLRLESKGVNSRVLVEFVQEKDKGLLALLTLLGFSKESLLRLITFIRVNDNQELNKLVLKDLWKEKKLNLNKFREWNLTSIIKRVKTNNSFAKGIINLFLEGGSSHVIRESLPLFEYKKLDIEKITFKTESLLDTIIRYRNKGSWKGAKENNPESIIEQRLLEKKISFEKGIGFRKIIGRDMDFVLPNKQRPKIFVESSYTVTTASGMGDKASNEQKVARVIRQKFNGKVKFYGFIDGIGWYVRRGDLKNMVNAFDDVFTFRKEEIDRFIEIIKSSLK